VPYVQKSHLYKTLLHDDEKEASSASTMLITYANGSMQKVNMNEESIENE
jgi:hypothetical protein